VPGKRVGAPSPAPCRRWPGSRQVASFFQRLAECIVGGQEETRSLPPFFTTYLAVPLDNA